MTAGADLRLLRAAVFTAACVVLSAAGHVATSGTHVPLWALGTGCALVFAVAAPLAGRERTLPGIAAALAAGQMVLHTLFSYGHATAAPGHGSAGSVGSGAPGGGLRALAGQLLCNDRAAAALTEAQARRIVARAGLPDGRTAEAAHAAHGTGTHGTGAHGAHAADAASGGPDSVAVCVREAVHAALAHVSVPMLLGHLLAAVAAGWLLRRGEAALWRLVRLSAGAARTAEDLLLVRALRWALRFVRVLLRGRTAAAGTPSPRPAAAPDRTPPPHTEALTGAATWRGPPGATDLLALAA